MAKWMCTSEKLPDGTYRVIEGSPEFFPNRLFPIDGAKKCECGSECDRCEHGWLFPPDDCDCPGCKNDLGCFRSDCLKRSDFDRARKIIEEHVASEWKKF